MRARTRSPHDVQVDHRRRRITSPGHQVRVGLMACARGERWRRGPAGPDHRQLPVALRAEGARCV